MEYNYSRPDFRLKYKWNDDTSFSLPLPPRNVDITSPYLIGVLDIRWDAPSVYAENNGLIVTGVNVYRSYDAPEGPYVKLNDTPIGALYYRDQTKEVFVSQEDPIAGGRLIPGTTATNDWIVKTINKPLVVPGTNGVKTAEDYNHVKVEVKVTSADPFVTVPAFKVIGDTGEIYLIKNRIYNHATNTFDNPPLPDLNAGGEVRVSYTYINNHIQTDINRKTYYKVTTVARDPENGNVEIETPLEQVEAFSPYDMEKIDWIWAESIRRNRWILEQGGERVKVFIHKWAGERCPCWDAEYRQPKSDCLTCYSSGYVGGFEGPYDLLVAPPETEKSVMLLDMGLHITYDWATWTGPYPLLNDRDFIVRQNNDRFVISNVNPQGSRGAIYQQHFMLAPLDQHDIRYKVPITGGEIIPPEAWDAYRVARPSDASPTIPDHPAIPEQYEKKGRTVTFENICYAIPLMFGILNLSEIVEGMVMVCSRIL